MRREIIFEFTRIGNLMRCSAVDSLTTLEVFVVGPANATRRDLQTLALRKLQRKIDEEHA